MANKVKVNIKIDYEIAAQKQHKFKKMSGSINILDKKDLYGAYNEIYDMIEEMERRV